jgi:[ribosomal protein S18]-alanine N-acetyltransferase
MGLFSFLKPRFEIVPLTKADVAAVARLHAASFAHPWSEKEILDLLANGAAFGEVATTAGRRKVGGFILSRLAADEAEILTVAVDKAQRGAGLGKRLVERNLTRARAAGAKAMFLEVDAGNAPAIAVYRRFGFEKVGERKGYYRRPDGAPATAQIMRAPLA